MTQKSSFKVREADLEDYLPDPSNANRGTERGQGMIEKSLQEVGPGRSLVADKNGKLVAGNKTQQAAIDSGMTKVVEVETEGDVIVVHKRMDWDLNETDGEARRYAYFDNRAGELSLDWDPVQVLADRTAGVNLDDLFNDYEMTDIMNRLEGKSKEPHYKPPTHDNAEANALMAKWNTQPGQIWEIKSVTLPESTHRLMCGDSRTDLPQLMGSEHADLLVTSPPYCVNKDYEQNMTVEEWRALIRDVFAAVKPYCATWFVNLANRRNGNDGFELNTFGDMVSIFEAMDVKMIALRIWNKPATWEHAHPYWRQTYKPVDDYEFLGLFGEKPPHKARLTSDENADWGYRGVWSMGSVASNRLQSARFTPELPTRAMRLLTDFGALVLEPFSGSGTTIAAGEAIGRQVYAMEKEAQDVAVALEMLTEDEGLEVKIVNA